MFSQLVVPLDGSAIAARALGPAAVLAREVDAPIAVVGYAAATFVDDLRRQISAHLEEADLSGVRVEATVEATDRAVSECLADVMDATPGGLLCMSSIGRGRTGAIFGSVAEGVLRSHFGPILLLGPSCDVGRFRVGGVMVVPLDGSETSESILPIASSWSIVFHYEPEVVSVAGPDASGALAAAARGGADAGSETAYVHRMADRISTDIGRPVNFDMLHHDNAVDGIVGRLDDVGASLVAISTHGATGLGRLLAGSVAMGVVHRAPCPALVHRPPHLPE